MNTPDNTLPPGWALCESKSTPGKTYYFNRKTGKSSWTRPQQAKPKPTHSKSRKKPNATKPKPPQQQQQEKPNLKRKSEGHPIESPNKKKPNVSATSSSSQNIKPTTPKKQETPKPKHNLANRRLQEVRAVIAKGFDSSESLNNFYLVSATSSSSTPQYRKETPKKQEIPTPKNNSANKRLQALRSRLSEELNDSPESARTKKTKQSNDDVKCLTTQSPGSDIQSSPSQFLAANIILSSMKAQISDKFCDKTEHKNTYADIEKGIYNHTPDFSASRHPSTLPQFSEASKIVSAIKSKLAYKKLESDIDISTYTCPSERLKSLRESLTAEISTDPKIDSPVVLQKQNSVEAMEVDIYKEVKPSPTITPTQTEDSENVILVVDTNIFIHKLDIIKNVLNSHIKGYSEQPTLLVPWRVISELDRLKDNNNGKGALCKRAKSAMDYLYQSLPENNKIKGQSLRDANSHIYPCEVPDDEILNCCLQQAERGKSVILLSNDKNLCNKAVINKINCIALDELTRLLENRTPTPSLKDPRLEARIKHYEDSMHQLLANILENEMRAKYNALWHRVVFKAPPWTLKDVLQCILKHWLAVFNEVFPRIEHDISELSNTLTSIKQRAVKSLTHSLVDNLKDLSLEVAKKCQIIPEYMSLAKLTVERLSKDIDLEEGCSSKTEDKLDESLVTEAFENVWTLYSSFCAKTATALGINHSYEDQITEQKTLEELVTQLPELSSHLYCFIQAINNYLNLDSSDDVSSNQCILSLVTCFKATLDLISLDSDTVNIQNLTSFCTNHRHMLQEAYTKFLELNEVLEICKNIASV